LLHMNREPGRRAGLKIRRPQGREGFDFLRHQSLDRLEGQLAVQVRPVPPFRIIPTSDALRIQYRSPWIASIEVRFRQQSRN